jgi:diaminopimelate epimerase
MQIHFSKYQGTGNDFIIINNFKNSIVLTTDQIAFLCNRKFGIGADGLMLLNSKDGYDFEMIYFNADGRESSMCGNGGRCLVQFAYDEGLQKKEFSFIAIDGKHDAIIEKSFVQLKMQDVAGVEFLKEDFVLNTGSPHYVHKVNDIASVNVFEEGRKIRYSEAFNSNGINVNFLQQHQNHIEVRTYERGVEDETLSCGTGVTACALVSAHNNGENYVHVKTPGGNLAVSFHKKENKFENIWLIGPATFVFKGEIII